MQTKLSKLQKEILIHLYHNQKTMVEFKKIKGKYYQRKQLFFDIAERHNKLVKRIKGWGAFRIHPSYFPTLKNSVISLIKRGLVKGWCWDRRLSSELEETDFLASIEYLQLTQEGIETAKGL